MKKSALEWRVWDGLLGKLVDMFSLEISLFSLDYIRAVTSLDFSQVQKCS